MGILLSLHEKATGPFKRVYEICLENMENVEGVIKSVAELPQIPFTNPIKRKFRQPETEPEKNSPKISKKRRRTKSAKKLISEAESSTSTSSRQKR